MFGAVRRTSLLPLRPLLPSTSWRGDRLPNNSVLLAARYARGNSAFGCYDHTPVCCRLML
jgi:hypothetical protein